MEEEFKFDFQVLVEGKKLSDVDIKKHFMENFEGDCLLVVGDEEMLKIHFHTNSPWEVLQYCISLGDVSDIVIENMERQARGLNG